MKRQYRIGIIPGDGIGRDVVEASLIVLEGLNGLMTDVELEFIPLEREIP